jgi:hypothetical protein
MGINRDAGMGGNTASDILMGEKTTIRFPDAKDERRWEQKFDDKPQPAPTSEPATKSEPVIPAKYRSRPLPRKLRKRRSEER